MYSDLLFFSAKAVQAGYFEEQTTGGRHPSDDKRYTIGMYVADKIWCQFKPGFTRVFFYLLSKNDAVKKIGPYLFYFTLHPPPTAAPREPRLSSVIKSVISLAIIWTLLSPCQGLSLRPLDSYPTTISTWPGKQSLLNTSYFYIFWLVRNSPDQNWKANPI